MGIWFVKERKDILKGGWGQFRKLLSYDSVIAFVFTQIIVFENSMKAISLF